MQSILQKKRTVLIVAGAIVVLSLAVIYLLSFWQALDTKRAADNFEKYLFNDLDIAKLDESGQGPLYDFYLYNLIESNIRVIESRGGDMADFFQDMGLEKYEKRAEEAEKLFLTQCEKNPEECHPRWSIMPYCMAQWVNRNVQDIDSPEFERQIIENRIFIESLQHWRDYLDKKEWQKDELSAVLGVVISQNLCGETQKIDIAKWSQKTIKINTETTDPEEEIRLNYKKIQIITHLHDGRNRLVEIPRYEGLEQICIMPSEKAILKGDVCDAHYYYRIKRFCLERGWAEYDQIGKYLKERHSDPEKLICQISLLRSFRGLF